jgi:sigma-B regulation protein RsbU (phosphoserine phosphatase)
MIFLGELRVEATLENLRTISYFIHGVGQRLQLTEETLFYIDLAVEEAAANIVHHAYPPDQVGEMLLRVEALDDVVHVTLTDWGMPLDPDDVKPFDIHAPVETRVAGGMGLHLIGSLMDGVVRRTSQAPGGPNTLTLIKHVKRLRPGARRPSTLRELSAMLTVGQIMAASTDLGDLLELIINELVEAIDAERGTLYLIDEDKGELFSRVLLEDTGSLKEIRLKVGEGIAGQVAATGEVLNIQHAYDDPRFMRSFDQLTGYRSRTILAAPMHNLQQKIIGVVQLLNKKGGPFTPRDERLLTAMAAQAAISIENSRLYAQEMQQRLINQELETARTIQKSFLPQTVPQHAGWDIGAFWRPMREVAGDFYDFYTLPDGRLAVVIADVSGKGVPAALFMALSVTVLRFAMSLNFAPGELMDHANQAIISNQQSRMFTTAFVGYLDLDSGVLQFASAGHNPPLLYRATTGRCEYLAAPGAAVGVFKEAAYAEERVTLADGDTLVLYTDGITEAINAEEEEFGEERLEALIAGQASRPAQELAELIVKAAAAFAQGQEPGLSPALSSAEGLPKGTFDDETLVVIKRSHFRAGRD